MVNLKEFGAKIDLGFKKVTGIIEGRLEGLEGRLGGLEGRLGGVGEWQRKYEKRIEKIDRVDKMCERMGGRLEGIEEALGRILEKIGG
jgi:hypothetical protein